MTTVLETGGLITVGAMHHMSLNVPDPAMARDFYTRVLGFGTLVEVPGGFLLTNGKMLLGVRLPPNDTPVMPDARFSEFGIGLDHLAFSVPDRAALEEAQRKFDEYGVPHGEITDLGPSFGIFVLFFRDPFNFQLELTAPRG